MATPAQNALIAAFNSLTNSGTKPALAPLLSRVKAIATAAPARASADEAVVLANDLEAFAAVPGVSGVVSRLRALAVEFRQVVRQQEAKQRMEQQRGGR